MSTLHHPRHEHALALHNLGENCKITCDLCNLDLQGPAPTYCCQDCGFFIHTSCVAATAKILHPAHPQHPLDLTKYASGSHPCFGCRYTSSGAHFMYKCYLCDFYLDVACVISTFHAMELEDEKANTIQHFAHEHPLTSFDVKVPNRINCRACQGRISGRVYGCRSCIFVLHESCAELPREMRHSLHPQHPLTLLASTKRKFRCRGCGKSYQIAYSCEECKLNLDVLCAVSTPPPPKKIEKDGIVTIDHLFHQHPLRFLDIREQNDALRCKACRLKLLGGTYCCLDCIFFLHESCAKLPHVIKHFLHQEHHNLKLRSCEAELPCSYCSCDCSGFTYGCDTCSYIIDLECFIGTLFAFKENQGGAILPFVHNHEMKLSYEKSRGTICDACRRPSTGLMYSCETPDCPVVLHTSCAELKKELLHPHHQTHPLVLLPKATNGSFICRACGETRHGSCYYCSNCKFHMEIGCALRKPTLKHQRHEHMLTYFQRAKNFRCNFCGKSCSVDLYRCVQCNFNLHHGCLPLPPIGKHEYHVHSLVLRDRVVDDFYEEQYCDACEEIRHPDHGVYYCAHCNFAAHIHCIIPSVEPENDRAEGAVSYIDKNIANTEAEIAAYDEEIANAEAEIEISKRNLTALQEKMDLLCKLRSEKEDLLFDLRFRSKWGSERPCCFYCGGEVGHSDEECWVRERDERYPTQLLVDDADRILKLYSPEHPLLNFEFETESSNLKMVVALVPYPSSSSL